MELFERFFLYLCFFGVLLCIVGAVFSLLTLCPLQITVVAILIGFVALVAHIDPLCLKD